MNECMAERDLIFGEISRERAAQDAQWGGKEHDDSHELFEWCAWIQKQNTEAYIEAHNAANFERRMVKVAALALAAIESSRRTSAGGDAPETAPASADPAPAGQPENQAKEQ